MNVRTIAAGALALAAAGAGLAASSTADAAGSRIAFDLQRSPGVVAAGCLTNATAHVVVTHVGQVEKMTVDATGLPPNTGFDLFVIQVPNAPFGVSWYQGDLDSNKWGVAHGEFAGRFSVETFAIAPGVAPAPSVHTSPTPDATSNPAFGPIHTYHLGVWFNSAADAVKAGCPGLTTPFNGDHHAGIQALNSGSFGDTTGPLRRLKP
ncbi:MAG: hypothetical protein ABI890_01635 [Lapillicoccus sp.]